jgi:hypothetical protein
MIKRIVVYSALIFLVNLRLVQAEYIIVTTNKSGAIVPLAPATLQSHHEEALFDSMMRYPWPQCTASAIRGHLTKQELAALTAPQPFAEESFLRAKLQALCGNSIDIVYVPTTLYELLVLREFLLGFSDQFMQLGIKLGQCYAETETSLTKLIAHHHDDLKAIINEYVRDYDPAHQARNLVLQATYLRLNFLVGTYLLSACPGATVDQLRTQLEQHAKKLAAVCIENIITIYENLFAPRYAKAINDSYTMFYFPELGIECANGSLSDGIVAGSLDLEYEAVRSNKAVLFRGAQPFQHPLTDNLVIDTTLVQTGNNIFKPRSLSFANTLFAGSIFGVNEMAYSFMSSDYNAAYGLMIDKADYCATRCDNLFFVTPFPTLVGLFVQGQFCHSRSCAAANQGTLVKEIHGFGYDAQDHSGLLLTYTDPLAQEKKLTKYFSSPSIRIMRVGMRAGVTRDRLITLLKN